MAELVQQSGSQLGLGVYHLCCELHTGEVPAQQRRTDAKCTKKNFCARLEPDVSGGACTALYYSLEAPVAGCTLAK